MFECVLFCVLHCVRHCDAQVGQTALHIACLWGNASAVRTLIGGGADVNQTNDAQMGEQTALHMLANRVNNSDNRWICCQLMLAAGANVSIANMNGDIPSQYLDEEVQGGDTFAAKLQVALTPK